MQRMYKGLLLAAVGLGMASGLSAESGKKWYEMIETSGYVDAYYQLSLNGHAPADRSYDVLNQQLDVQGAEIGFKYNDQGSGTSAMANFMFGEEVTATNDRGSTFGQGTRVMEAEVSQILGPVTASIGKMVTFIGEESVYQTSNWLHSRSLLFGAEPVFGYAIRANYAVSGNLRVLAQMDDGTNTLAGGSTGEGKGYGAQVAYTRGSLGLTGGWYMADERLFVSAGENTQYLNLLASYGTGSWNFAGEYLYKTYLADPNGNGFLHNGQPYSPKAQGYALYADYETPVNGLSLVGRLEQLFNPDLVAASLAPTNDTQQNEITLAAKYKIGDVTNFLELRDDTTPSATFLPAGGSIAAKDLLNYQMTITYAAVVSF